MSTHACRKRWSFPLPRRRRPARSSKFGRGFSGRGSRCRSGSTTSTSISSRTARGFALIDTGIDNAGLARCLGGAARRAARRRKLTRIIATHFHPDHIGLAGWLCERFDLPLAMSQTEYLIALNIRLDPAGLKSEPYRGFYRSHGLSDEARKSCSATD